MICRDHCNGWYHGDCVGITPDMGKKMSDDKMEYRCICVCMFVPAVSQILPW